MEIIVFTNEEKHIRQFLDFPATLYSPRELMQSRETEEQLLRGRHFLNRYAALTAFLAVEGETVLARCILTEYPQEKELYFGFFECVEDGRAADLLLSAVEECAASKGYLKLVGPVDVSIWVRYRFKTNLFDLRPYTGEPYNKAYYPELFTSRGYRVRERYVSNRYRRLPRKKFAIDVYKAPYEAFLKKGYEIRSPELENWDRDVRAVYRLVSRLYTGFEAYKPVSEDEFASMFSDYKRIVDLSLIKIAYFKGVPVGFFMGVPNYHNLASRKMNLAALAEVLIKRKRCREYVLLYMGVEPEHKGLGKALTHSIMQELAKKGAASIGALIREGNPNYNYASEVMEGRYQYVLLEKQLDDCRLPDG